MYYIRLRKEEKGPYSEDQLRDLLARLKIGRRTPCRPVDGDGRWRDLERALPHLMERVDRRREDKAARRGERGPDDDRHRSVVVTTESAPVGLHIGERLGIVTAEVVFGVNAFKEALAGVRNFVGGRSGTLQNVLRDARETVLDEMMREAHRRGANAVVAVSLNYNEITTGGSTMLLLVGAGTAVYVSRADADPAGDAEGSARVSGP